MKGVATGVVLTILAGGGIRAVQFYRSGEILSDVSFTQKVKYLENMIDEEYLGDISTDDLKEGVYAGLIYGLDDVYSRYYTKEQYDQENATTEGSYVGIGVSMQQNAAGGVQIVECYKGSTAEEAGIKAGDVITAIDGEDITDAELSDVVSMIKKKQDEDVVLTVQRQGEDTQEITVKVSDVELPSVFGEMLDENTGYIQITEFKGVTAQQYEETFADLKDQGMTRLIVDLRDNPGGLLNIVCDILRDILPEGLIVYTEDKKFTAGGIVVHDDKIESIYTTENVPDMLGEEVIDGQGAYAIPGLIDLHFHGCMGDDFCDNSKEAIENIAKYEASVGVTTIAPATMTLPVEELEDILRTAAEYKKEQNPKGADLVGVNMEGPFISPVKKGAQDERNIMPCDTAICQRFLDASEGLVKFVGLAPEESEDAVAFVEAMKDKVNISLAHTNADYAHAKAAFDAGANHAVHLFNAMPAFTHREPGVVGAVSDSAHVMAEIICDGVHIHPSMVRAAFKMMGADRMILISDSMRATGMPDGQYTLGGLDVKVVGNHATLVSDGALAGSVTNLADCMRTVVKKMEIPLETAIACATINPAKSLGIEDTYGSIAPGKKANIVLLDENLELKMVIKDGQEL